MDLVAPNVQHREREYEKLPAKEADGGLYNGENFLAQSNVEELADTAATLLVDDDDANCAIS